MAHFFLDISFLMGGYFFADMAELADALDLGSSPSGCRFDSCYPHFFMHTCIYKANKTLYLIWNIPSR